MAEPAYAECDRRAPRPDYLFTLTASNGQTATYRYDPDRPDEWLNMGPRFGEASERVRKAHEARVAATDALGIDAIMAEDDRLDQIRHDAEWALIRTPAPDLKALHWKLERLLGPDQREEGCCPNWTGSVLDIVMADATRLLGGEARG